ncbi:testis-expressed protein 36-like [Anneissia japonica]|uniref:testis-expressed protein 36-like n=1 Tax=Anneissia japonica TaxID=1529436 RepID=UPI0014259168|nr:testis-expressed protein 36-like [Anneissia japonica]
MPRSRKFSPATNNDGVWFRTRGWTHEPLQRSSATSTGDMLTSTFKPESSAFPKPPPEPFTALEKSSYIEENPFSGHDNRHSFQDHGVYFGQGLGKKLWQGEKRQHNSRDLITWENGNLQYSTYYRDTYKGTPCKEPLTQRRFPRIHTEPKQGTIKLETTTTDWYQPPKVPYETPTQILASSQEPFLEHNPWRYSYKSY